MTTPAALRIFEHDVTTFRRLWRGSLVTSFGHPLLWILAFGLGVGGLVDEGNGATNSIGNVPYLAFIGPGLIGSTCMMTGAGESMWPVLGGIKWSRRYHAILAAPLTSRDIVNAHVLWIVFRSFITATAIAVVLLFPADTRSIGLLGAVLGGILTALAFAMPIAAWTMTVDRENAFSALQRFGLTPMYLFAGAIFPVAQLPGLFRVIAYLTPVYHGVSLCRSFTLQQLDRADAGHALVLVAFTAVGYAVCLRNAARRLTA